jgi:hypothetical protein
VPGSRLDSKAQGPSRKTAWVDLSVPNYLSAHVFPTRRKGVNNPSSHDRKHVSLSAA